MRIITVLILLSFLISCDSGEVIPISDKNNESIKMESLEEIRMFDFSGYDSASVNRSKIRIENLTNGIGEIWGEWNKSFKQDSDTLDLEIDFDFYSANEKLSKDFSLCAKNNGFNVELKSERSMLFLKGYEIRISKRQKWTIIKLIEEIERLGLIGRKYDCLLEGYGAKVN